MLKVIAAVALVAVFLVPAVAAFAADEAGGGDRDPYVVQEVTQVEPTAPGTIAGSDQPYFGPYFEQHLDNMEH